MNLHAYEVLLLSLSVILRPTWKGAYRLQMSTFLNSLPLKEFLQQDCRQPD